MRTPIDTGDNRKKGEEALINMAKRLCISRGCKPPKSAGDVFSDATGQRYAYRMTSREGLFFMFVARATGPYGKGHLVSVHKKLVEKAAQEDVPIVMYWPAQKRFTFEYNLFDPKLILEATRIDSVNIRLGEEMLNFMASLGLGWPRERSLQEMRDTLISNSLKWREWGSAPQTASSGQVTFKTGLERYT